MGGIWDPVSYPALLPLVSFDLLLMLEIQADTYFQILLSYFKPKVKENLA